MEVNSDIILSVYIISFLIGFPSNVLALYAFSVKIHSKPRPMDILLLNLTVSDLLLLIFITLEMHALASDLPYRPYVLYTITAFIIFWTTSTSSLLLMAVSMVRYIGVAFPINYHLLQRPLYAVVIGAVCWIISGAHCTITTIIVSQDPDCANITTHANHSVCYREFREKQQVALISMFVEILFVLCLVPLTVCIYCYLHCICILYRNPGFSQKQKRKSIGMALGTLAVFLVCVIPFNVTYVLVSFGIMSQTWRKYFFLLCVFNTCIDPIIFCFSSPGFFSCSGEKSIFKKLGLLRFNMQGTNAG